MAKPSVPSAADHRPMSAFVGIATLVLTLLSWSSVPLFVTHFANKNVDLFTSNGWRYGISAVFWLPVLIWCAMGMRGSKIPKGLWTAAVVPSVFNILGQTAFAWAFYEVDTTTATFGVRMQIIFVAIGAYFLFDNERALLRRPATWLAIALVIVGVAGTVYAGLGDATIKITFGGMVLAISGGALFGAYGLAVRKCMSGFHPVVAFAAIANYTAVAMVGLMFAFGDQFGFAILNGPAPLSGFEFFNLLLSGFIGIAFGHVVYYIAIARLGVAVSSGVIQLQPFCVALAIYALDHTRPPTLGQMAAGAVAFAGAVLLLQMQWLTSKQARAERLAAETHAAAKLDERTATPDATGGFGQLVVAPADETRIEPIGDLDAIPAEVGNTK